LIYVIPLQCMGLKSWLSVWSLCHVLKTMCTKTVWEASNCKWTVEMPWTASCKKLSKHGEENWCMCSEQWKIKHDVLYLVMVWNWLCILLLWTRQDWHDINGSLHSFLKVLSLL
jgi:hypothetical protein